MTERLIILDRDGVINEDSDDYIKSLDEWLPIPGSLEAIGKLTSAGWEVVIATNQSGIGRGLYSIETMHAMHRRLIELIAPFGGQLAGVFYCPHTPDQNCDCRKPKAGMFREIAARYGRDRLDGVPLVGDSLRDLQAGMVLGCQPYLVLTGKGAVTFLKGTHEGSLLPQGTRVRVSLAALAQELCS